MLTPGMVAPVLTLGMSEEWMVFGSIAMVWIIGSASVKIARTMARERTRREIAAYIAEGSMSPEQGEKLMKSGERGEA